MPRSELTDVAVAARLLQNGYAYAVDIRDWSYFATLFTPEIRAEYPNTQYNGMAEWLSEFIPFHDECGWTSHVLTNHLVGEDESGIWATCYGWVQWTHNGKPDHLNRATVLFRDRLEQRAGEWLIGRRKLHVLMSESVPIPSGLSFPNSILGLADRS